MYVHTCMYIYTERGSHNLPQLETSKCSNYLLTSMKAKSVAAYKKTKKNTKKRSNINDNRMVTTNVADDMKRRNSNKRE